MSESSSSGSSPAVLADKLSHTEFVKRYLYDFELFCQECIHIQTKSGETVPFRFNRIQKYLWEELKKDLMSGTPIRWIILKARQMGMSTFITALCAWVVFLRKNRNAIIAAHDEDASTNLYSKIQFAYRLYPPNHRPMFKINNRGRLHLTNPDPKGKPGLESQVLVSLSDNINIGRSFAIHFFHGSEVAFWKDPKTLLGSLKNAMPKIAGTFLFLESTAFGDNYFKTLWDEAEERGYRRVFISWVAFETYTVTNVSMEELKEFEKQLTDVNDPLYGNELEERLAVEDELRQWWDEAADPQWLWAESLRRLMWRRQTIVDEAEKDLATFRREYPTRPDDAFSLSGESVFNAYKLTLMLRELLKEPVNVKRFKWTGDDWLPSAYGELHLLAPLDKDMDYVIAADTSLGVEGGDPSAAVILRLSDGVVVGFYSAVVEPDIFASLLWDLGHRAGKCKIGVEANEHGGYRVNELLWEWGYPSIYYRKMADTINKKLLQKIGWRTTPITKQSMMVDLKAAINEDHIHILFPEILKQLLKYRQLGNGKYGVPPPEHDDLASATMIAWQLALEWIKIAPRVNASKPKKWSIEWWARLDEDPEETQKWKRRVQVEKDGSLWYAS